MQITYVDFFLVGIGKSAVANSIFVDERRGNPFAQKFWVTVGGTLDETGIIKDMLRSLKHDVSSSSSDTKETLSRLLTVMNKERVLLVLDDVRFVSQEQFEDLLYRLQRDGAKISVLVTTRRIETARTIGASYTHDLEGLSKDDSWNLFKSIVSHPFSDTETASGKEIVQKCHGVPLVIRKMASLLQNSKNVSEWMKMADGELWDLPNFKSLSTLSLTYDRLPKALKRCFAYCSIFPKDAIIRKSDLIRLWLAQGFLPEEKIESSVETGEKFFDMLLHESLLQVREQDEDSNVVDCTMRESAHDLAMYFSRHDTLIKDDNRHQPSQSDVRHLVFSSRNMTESNTDTSHFTRVRTIYLMGPGPDNQLLVDHMVAVLETMLSQARYLYVLILDGIGLKEVPKNLEKLKYLRYLDLSNNPIKYVPDSIAHLYLLQTLLLRNCQNLENIEGIAKLTYLSLVEVSPKQLPNQIVPPSALKMQPPIKLDEKGAAEAIIELRDRTDIAGSLSISCLEYVKNKETAQEARIGKKHNLSALELKWSRERPEAGNSQQNQDEDVLHGFQPHSNIRRLNLINYDSERFPMWMMNMKGEDNKRLYRLAKIELVSCKSCLRVPTMGQLPCLRELLIAGMDKIESIGDELYRYAHDNENKDDTLEVYFPALRRLELRDLERLEKWQPANTTDRRAFLNLEILRVVNCPNLTSIPTDFPRMKSLLIQGIERNHWLDKIVANSCKNHTLTSLVLCRVRLINQTLPRELFLCTSLEEFSLLQCKDFKKWPANPWSLNSLKELCIDGCPSLIYPPHVDSLTALNTLVIRGCENLKGVPIKLGTCISLTKLAITGCSTLEKIPDLQNLTNLEELDILDCVKIRSLPAGLDSLPRLRIMRVGGLSDKFDKFPQCQSLERLWLKGMPDGLDGLDPSKYLPHNLKLLTQLKVLRIRSFDLLEAVPRWICDLKDLEILIFEDCNKLKVFPSQIRMLQLKKLRCLRIENCAALESKSILDDVKKSIRHVPHVKINGFWLQDDRSFLLQESPVINAPWSRSVSESDFGNPDTNVDEELNDEAFYDIIWDILNDYIGGRTSLCFYSFTVSFVLCVVINSLHSYWTTSKQH